MDISVPNRLNLRTMRFPLSLLLLVFVAPAGCNRHREDKADPPGAANDTAGTGGNAPSWVPPDGKYERVTVDGVTVPMIDVMNHGTVVLVDTDGVKPRTWEEQYKRKGEIAPGSFDLHKTNVNKNDSFEDDPIDRQGLWAIDAKGNITQK